jgi:hypothetical protein
MARTEQKINYKEIEQFGLCYMSVKAMARLLGVSETWVKKALANEKSQFHRAYYRGQARTEYELSRTMLTVALGKQKEGNQSLLSHLCGQWLGWKHTAKTKENNTEAAEKLLENVSDSQKSAMFNALAGLSPNTDEEIDDGTDTESKTT